MNTKFFKLQTNNIPEITQTYPTFLIKQGAPISTNPISVDKVEVPLGHPPCTSSKEKISTPSPKFRALKAKKKKWLLVSQRNWKWYFKYLIRCWEAQGQLASRWWLLAPQGWAFAHIHSFSYPEGVPEQNSNG